MGKIRILLADDHSLIRSGIRNLFQGNKEFLFVGEAGDGEETIKKAEELAPDVVIVDIAMPKISGIDATRIIRERYPLTRVLILTMHENEEYIYQIVKSGAGGYVLKSAGKDEIEAAIRAVARGDKFFSPRISELMIDGYMKRAENRETSVGGAASLTKREQEILAMIARGHNNQQIAEQLFISPRTVDTHRTNIMQKLDIHDIANLVRYAIENGYADKGSGGTS